MNSLFFLCYETIKEVTEPLVAPKYVPVMHMVAASFCEVVSNLLVTLRYKLNATIPVSLFSGVS